ncbi:Rho GTPase activation protein [Radiomyces spectabilis]|uniref:Rho GTPase activation protein n=1 Tax=Radiomyces spectabilis TaxID=64574 RepID=UPI00221F18AD|nr:Rho GTPase activation protein [Radiomyces spectabilis]KAI8388072.1 Rho GTPase activation protein [Radiomyces spectabilis]
MNNIRRALSIRRRQPSSPSTAVYDYRVQPVSSIHSASSTIHMNQSVPTIAYESIKHEIDVPERLVDLSSLQDILIRHIATIYLEHYIEDQDLQRNLIVLLEAKKASSLWGKLKSHIRVGTYKHLLYADAVATTERKFGVPLAALAASPIRQDNDFPAPICLEARDDHASFLLAMLLSRNASVPLFVRNCILALMQKDVSVEGIFRKNGNIREQKQMCETIDQQACDVDYYSKETPIQLAALLKRFLRQLPEPLLTFELYKAFMMAIRMKNEEDMKNMLYLTCCILPKPNRDVMQVVFLFLAWVASFHAKNKMDINNLARIIAPNVLYPAKDTRNTEHSVTTGDEIQVVALLIKFQKEFCVIPFQFATLLQDPKLLDPSSYHGPLAIKNYLRTYVKRHQQQRPHHSSLLH